VGSCKTAVTCVVALCGTLGSVIRVGSPPSRGDGSLKVDSRDERCQLRHGNHSRLGTCVFCRTC